MINKPKFFFRAKFEIFVYLEKIQKKTIFETNLSVIGLSGTQRRAKIRKCQIWSKIEKRPIFNIFQKFRKHVNSYPILYQNAKFGGPRVKNVGFRAKKLIFRILENIGYLRLKFFRKFFFQKLSPPSVFALET